MSELIHLIYEPKSLSRIFVKRAVVIRFVHTTTFFFVFGSCSGQIPIHFSVKVCLSASVVKSKSKGNILQRFIKFFYKPNTRHNYHHFLGLSQQTEAKEQLRNSTMSDHDELCPPTPTDDDELSLPR